MAKARIDHKFELLRAVQEGLIDKTKELLSLNLLKFNDKEYFDYYLIIRTLAGPGINLAKLLIEKGFRVYKKSKTNQEKTLLHAAIQTRDLEFIATLLAKGASPDILTLDEQNKTPFHLAIDENQFTIIELFLSYFDAKTFDKKCLLHYAIEKNDIPVVSLLIEKGLSLKKKNEINSTPLCVALKNKNFKILNILLSYCTMTKIEPKNYDDFAPVYVAIICGNIKVIKKYVGAGLPINIPLKSSNNAWPSLENCLGFTLLHFAVKQVKLKIVKYLLSKGADILAKDTNGSSPLHIAFENKEKGIWKTWQDFDDNNSIIDMILQANTKSNSNPINKHGLSHFHVACSRDEPTVVEHFLKLGTSINRPAKVQCYRYKKYSPLHFAAKFRCTRTMEVLLKNGANVKQKDFQKMTALHIAARESCLHAVSLLLQYGADIASKDSHGKTPVHRAFEKKNYEILDQLLSVPNVASSNPMNSAGVSHFHIACTRNNVKAVESFIENGVCLDTCVPTRSDGDVDTNDADWSGFSPLHFAISHNRAKIVQLLLASGANVGLKNSKGSTPLHFACEYTHEMFAEFIKNILSDSSKQGKVIQQLKPVSDIVEVSEIYFNGLSGSVKKIDWSNSRTEYIKIINTLLNYGADVNCSDNFGNAPVFYAYASVIILKKRIHNSFNCSNALWSEIVESLSKELYQRRKLILNNLLKLDLDLDKCYKNGSILRWIVFNRQDDEESGVMMELFLKRGANVNAKLNELDITALHYAAIVEDKNLMSILLEYNAEVDCIVSKNNLTPLQIATAKSKPMLYDQNVIKILLDKGANPNAKHSYGRTALHNVAMRYPNAFSNADGTVSTLIKAGADIDIRDSKGLTALHIACERLNRETVLALLMYGADVNVEDGKGRSVYCYLYKKFLRYLGTGELDDHVGDVMWTLRLLQKHINKMNAIGLPVSGKVASSSSKIADHVRPSDEDQKNSIERFQAELQVLRDTKIHARCSLHDVIFKKENALAQIVKNRTFKIIVQSKSFEKKYPYYGYLVQLKYQAGVDRAKLLPAAKFLLNELVGMHLPDTCSENICEYFNNVELKESSENLRGILDLRVQKSDDIQLRSRRTSKRQKVN